MRFTKKLKKEIVDFVQRNNPKLEWNGNDFDKDTVVTLLEKGMDSFEEDVWDRCIDYISDLEREFVNYVITEFEIPDELEDEASEFIREHMAVDLNTKSLYSAIGDIDVLLVFYSNYDCCNSCDDPYEKSGSYLSEVYRRIRTGVSREDFAWEFYNGAYGGALFMMGVSCSVGEYLQLKKDMEDGEKITIKKGTPFGFHSSMHGASTPFEKVTKKDMTIAINGETKWDSITPEADLAMSGYNLRKVFGCSMNFAGKLPVVKKAKKPKEGR